MGAALLVAAASCSSSHSKVGPVSPTSSSGTSSNRGPGDPNLAAPTTPGATMLYAGPGVEVIGMGSTQENLAPTLSTSTDGSRWTDITPPEARHPDGQGRDAVYSEFETATFVNAEVGWVVACLQSANIETIYETADGGATWTSVPGGGCFHGIDNVQLVDPHFAIKSNTCAGIPCPLVSSSANSGRTWTALITLGESPGNVNNKDTRPLWPVRFVNHLEGFSASLIGDIQHDDAWPPSFFAATRDGGHSWTQTNPPTTSAASAQYDLPTFFDADHGVLPTLSGPNAAPTLGFDVTADGGRTWHIRKSMASSIRTVDHWPLQNIYPAVSVVTSDLWWVTNPTSPTDISITTDGGANWATVKAAGLPLPPIQLAAISASRAFAWVQVPGGTKTDPAMSYSSTIYTTDNGGRTWMPVALSTPPASTSPVT